MKYAMTSEFRSTNAKASSAFEARPQLFIQLFIHSYVHSFVTIQPKEVNYHGGTENAENDGAKIENQNGPCFES